MINLGNKAVKKAPDGTILSKDNMPSAHYEHTIAVRTAVSYTHLTLPTKA